MKMTSFSYTEEKQGLPPAAGDGGKVVSQKNFTEQEWDNALEKYMAIRWPTGMYSVHSIHQSGMRMMGEDAFQALWAKHPVKLNIHPGTVEEMKSQVSSS